MTTHALITLSNTSATRLTPLGTHPGMDLTIQNVHHEANVYLGNHDVTSNSYGFMLTPGNAWSIELSGKDCIYAITDTNESKVAVLKTNLELGV